MARSWETPGKHHNASRKQMTGFGWVVGWGNIYIWHTIGWVVKDQTPSEPPLIRQRAPKTNATQQNAALFPKLVIWRLQSVAVLAVDCRKVLSQTHIATHYHCRVWQQDNDIQTHTSTRKIQRPSHRLSVIVRQARRELAVIMSLMIRCIFLSVVLKHIRFDSEKRQHAHMSSL